MSTRMAGFACGTTLMPPSLTLILSELDQYMLASGKGITYFKHTFAQYCAFALNTLDP